MLFFGAMKNKNTQHTTGKETMGQNYLENLENENRQERIAELYVFKLTAQRLCKTAIQENNVKLYASARYTLALAEFALARKTG